MYKALTPEDIVGHMAAGSAIVDTREPQNFIAHIPGSYNIYIECIPMYSMWVIDPGKPIILVTERDNDIARAANAFQDAGYGNVIGYLEGGFSSWAKSGLDVDFTGLLVPDALAGMLSSDDVYLIDVRDKAEWDNGHIKEAHHIFIGEMADRVHYISERNTVVCTSSRGYRGSLGASILRRAGITLVYNVLGGIDAWKRKDYPLVYERLLDDRTR